MTKNQKSVKQRCIRMFQRTVNDYDKQIKDLSHDRDMLAKRISEMRDAIKDDEYDFHSHYLVYMRDENAFLAEHGFRTADYKKATRFCYHSAMNFINASNTEDDDDNPSAILVGDPDYIDEVLGEER